MNEVLKKETPQPPIDIRRGKKEDIPQIKQSLIDSWVEHAKHEPELLDEARMRSSDVERYYEDCFDKDDCVVLVAERDGRFAGFIRADVQEIPNFFRHNHILYLDDVCVVPEFRRQGVARSLLREVETIAKERGIKRLQGRVYSYNDSIQNLLKEMGYHSPHATWDKVLE